MGVAWSGYGSGMEWHGVASGVASEWHRSGIGVALTFSSEYVLVDTYFSHFDCFSRCLTSKFEIIKEKICPAHPLEIKERREPGLVQ